MSSYFKLIILLISTSLLVSCSTTKQVTDHVSYMFDDMLIKTGIKEKPVNPDHVTIAIMEMRNDIQENFEKLQQLQKANMAIKNSQMQLEILDKQLRGRADEALMIKFDKILAVRQQIEEANFKEIEKVSKSIKRQERKRSRTIKLTKKVLRKFPNSPELEQKIAQQRRVLDNMEPMIRRLSGFVSGIEKNFEALVDYTLNYDKKHPAISGDAF